ncbi:20880_t:CDS:2, partial [Cetraspora pellucida]
KLKSKDKRIENRLIELEYKLENNFDFKNEKIFKKDTIKGAAKELITYTIYSDIKN